MGTWSDVRERGMIDVGRTRLYPELRGSAEPLLCIAGGTGDAGEWDGVAPVLRASTRWWPMTGAVSPAAGARPAGAPPAWPSRLTPRRCGGRWG